MEVEKFAGLHAKEVTFSSLWADIGGGSRFTPEQIEVMMSDCLDTQEPFLMVHNNKAYIIPLKEVQAYFVEHVRPEKRNAGAEEVEDLKRKLESLTKELELSKRAVLTAQGIEAQRNVAEPVVKFGDPEVGETASTSGVGFQEQLAADLAKVKKPKPVNKAL